MRHQPQSACREEVRHGEFAGDVLGRRFLGHPDVLLRGREIAMLHGLHQFHRVEVLHVVRREPATEVVEAVPLATASDTELKKPLLIS